MFNDLENKSISFHFRRTFDVHVLGRIACTSGVFGREMLVGHAIPYENQQK